MLFKNDLLAANWPLRGCSNLISGKKKLKRGLAVNSVTLPASLLNLVLVTSASPLRIGWIILSTCLGTNFWRSASINTTTSPLEFLNPVFIAAPFPRFLVWLITIAPASFATCSVASKEPSLTTMISST